MSGVFKNFCFIIVKNEYANEDYDKLLLEDGCQYAKVVPMHILSDYLKSATEDLPDVILCDEDPKELLPYALKLMIPIVRSFWVHHCIELKKIVPVEPFQYIREEGQHMKIHISRYSFNEQERKFLSNMVYILGGYVTESISSNSITHYITRSGEQESDKIQKAMRLCGDYDDIEFVDEKWLLSEFYKSKFHTELFQSAESVESVESVDEEDEEDEEEEEEDEDAYYEHNRHFNPYRLSGIFGQYGQNEEDEEDEEEDETKDNSKSLIFKGYKFMIDLQMCKSLTSHLSTMIKTYGGSIISREEFELENDEISTTTVYLSEYDGNETIRVNCSMKFNLQWVFDCLLQRQFILNNDHKMIHSIPTATQRHICDNMKISYTHFVGLKRHNIINQIEMLGGEAQSFVCKDTDILVVGKPQDSKYEYCKRNDICMVTSQWLEDSFKANERAPYFLYDPVGQQKKDQSKASRLQSEIEKQYGSIDINLIINEREDMKDDDSDRITIPMNGKDVIITSSPSSIEEPEPMISSATFMRVDNVIEAKSDVKVVSNGEYGNATEAKSGVKADTDPAFDNDIEVGNATEAKSGVKADTDLAFDNDIEVGNATEAKIGVKADTDPAFDNDIEVGNDTEAKSDLKACSGIEAKSDMKGNSDNEGNTGTKVYNSKEMADESVVASAPTNGKRMRDSSTTITSSTTSGDEVKRVAKRRRVDEPLKEQLPIDDTERIYDIHCVSTQCLDKLSAHDRELLKLVGIHVYDEINNENIGHLNTVIAPKRIRTLKFLISLSFEPLKYALLPKFIMTILKSIKNALKRGDGINDLIRLDPLEYTIPGMDEIILKKTGLSHGNNNNNNKVFSRSKISSINLSANIQGGTNTLTSILQRHGIERVNVLNKKFSIEDIVSNDHSRFENDEEIPDYILITDQQSQMKQFKSVMQEQFKSAMPKRRVLIVEWNWCVQCIFNLEVSYDKKNSAILYYE